MNRLLSRQARRHGDAEDRRLFPARTAAAGRHRARLPFRRHDARLPALLRRACPGRQGAGGESAWRRSRRSRRPIRCACWRSTRSACTTPRPRKWARSSSPPNSAAAARRPPRRRGIARRGVINVLRHAGIVGGQRRIAGRRNGSTCRRSTAFPLPRTRGCIEAMVDLGDPIEKGEIIARVHAIDPHRPAAAGHPRQAVRRAGGTAFSGPRQAGRLRLGGGRPGGLSRRGSAGPDTDLPRESAGVTKDRHWRWRKQRRRARENAPKPAPGPHGRQRQHFPTDLPRHRQRLCLDAACAVDPAVGDRRRRHVGGGGGAALGAGGVRRRPRPTPRCPTRRR